MVRQRQAMMNFIKIMKFHTCRFTEIYTDVQQNSHEFQLSHKKGGGAELPLLLFMPQLEIEKMVDKLLFIAAKNGSIDVRRAVRIWTLTVIDKLCSFKIREANASGRVEKYGYRQIFMKRYLLKLNNMQNLLLLFQYRQSEIEFVKLRIIVKRWGEKSSSRHTQGPGSLLAKNSNNCF